MKTFLTLLVVAFQMGQLLYAAEEEIKWPGQIVTEPTLKERSMPDKLNAKLPEDFDWQRYIMENGSSTIDQRDLALMACSVLWKRLTLLEEAKREECLKSGGQKFANAFDQMQKEWRKLCALETVYFAGPEDEYKGSGYKAYYPMYVADQIQSRILWLKRER